MTNNNQHIPSGYKPSPLGIIPEDWEVKRIGDFGKVITGNTPPTEDTDNYGDVYKFVSPADISGNKYIEATEKHLSEKGFSISRQMPKGTVLFTCIGSTIGKCAIANEALTSNQQINAIICDSKHSGEFLYYELCHRSNRIKQIAGEQAVPIINKSTFESYKVLCPPFEEQKNIAEILSLWDTAIAKQTALIERLTLRKRGLMQQLLTGRKRLKGFGGEWKEVRLGEVCDLTKGEQVNSETLTETGLFPVINGGITPSGYKDDYNTEANTITISEGGNSCGFVNLIKTKFWSSGHCYTISNIINFDLIYLYYSLKFAEPHIMNLRVGSGLPNIQLGSLQKFTLLMPQLEEQKAIAAIIGQPDKEIEMQKQKLAAMQEQKKGVMQVLLTGKRRIAI